MCVPDGVRLHVPLCQLRQGAQGGVRALLRVAQRLQLRPHGAAVHSRALRQLLGDVRQSGVGCCADEVVVVVCSEPEQLAALVAVLRHVVEDALCLLRAVRRAGRQIDAHECRVGVRRGRHRHAPGVVERRHGVPDAFRLVAVGRAHQALQPRRQQVRAPRHSARGHCARHFGCLRCASTARGHFLQLCHE